MRTHRTNIFSRPRHRGTAHRHGGRPARPASLVRPVSLVRSGAPDDTDEEVYLSCCEAGGDVDDVPRGMSPERAEELRRIGQARLNASRGTAPNGRLYGVPNQP